MDGGAALLGELFGRMRVTVDGRQPVVSWPRPTARRLVALLLLAPEHLCSRARVADALFPHLEPDRAGRAVSKALSMARAVLDEAEVGPSALDADRQNIWISDHVHVEVDVLDHLTALEQAMATADEDLRVERLRDALREDRPVLVDDTYEDWAMEVAEHVERARADARLSLARTTHAVRDWQAIAAADPASVEASTALVEHHLRAGRPREAAQAVDTCSAGLRRLGLPVPAELAAVQVFGPHVPAASWEPWPLFGRDAELTEILDLVGPAAAGRGGAVLVAGVTGIGKTHLLRHTLARLAEEGWTVATGTSVRDDRLAPFASLRTALLPHLSGPTSPFITRLLLPEALDATVRPLPPAELAVLTDALRQHLDRLAGPRPLVLCLDDFHWADRALQEVVARLASDVAGRRWSLLLAARTDEPDAPVPEVPTRVRRLTLGPLGPAAGARLADHAATQAGTPPLGGTAAELAERAGGHPFFIVELARSVAIPEPATAGSAMPERIIELLRRRVARCSPAARRVTALVAIAGDDATIELIERTGEPFFRDEAELADVLDELQRAALVQADDDRLRLAHPLLRDAAESAINLVRRAQLHDRVADALEAGGRVGGVAVLSIAHHRLAAFRATYALEHAAPAAVAGFDGARVAYGLGSADAAEELYLGALEAFAALDERDRHRLRHEAFSGGLGLGRVRMDSGSYRGAAEAAEASLRMATTPDERGLAWWLRTEIVYRQGDLIASIALLEDGLRDLPADASAARARLLTELGWCHHRRNEDARARPLLHESVELAEESGDWCVLTAALDRYAFSLASSGAVEEALAVYDRAQAAARRCGDRNEQAIVHLHHSVAWLRHGRYDEAAAELEVAAELCDRYGFVYDRSVAHWGMAWVEEARGQPSLALGERDAELQLLRELDNDRNLAGCQAHRSTLLRGLGREAEADQAAREAREAARRVGDPSLLDEIDRELAGPAVTGASDPGGGSDRGA
jgi:DNA-binding SARP family transcriptional activator/tetratricopeptide (TPR) repeat protein